MNPVKQIPNVITMMNLVSGAISIVCTFNGEYESSFYFMLLAALFDFLDGFAARLLKAYSDIGKELDSLADVISFGLAPSLLLFQYLTSIDTVVEWVSYIPLIIAPFTAYRLAKFNLDKRQTSSFLGLPSPASALFVGSLIFFSTQADISWFLNNNFTIPILSLLLSYLLVSEIPMFSLKLKSLKWRDNERLFTFLIIVVTLGVLLIVMGRHWSSAILLALSTYILWNLALYLIGHFTNKK